MFSNEEMRVAIEDQIRKGLANAPGDWIGTTNSGQEIEFQPRCDEDGKFSVFCNEKEIAFRVRVEIVD